MKNLILLILIALVLFGCTKEQVKETKIDNMEPNVSTKVDTNTTKNETVIETVDAETRIVKTGDTVSVDYIGTLDNGTIFDQSKKPFQFTVGAGQVISGFNDALVGMKINEEKTVHISVENAYGYSSEEQIISVAIEKIDGGNITVGQIIYADNGAQGIVKKIENGQAAIDFNHPLAGQALNFKITLKGIE